ncbi:MAG: class I SAM-dependent methyltransferase family protein [Solirubrobacterales bacterium]|nr:class I SAM-dependent methyltransferase family protein [Solirubrobacterales bacterium]
MPTGTDTVASPTFLELQRELAVLSPRAWRFGALTLASRAGALVSEGLRIGHRYGFDSGPFMAHVYENAPRGRTRVGTAIDRRLLARRTCQAFREIRVLARDALDEALAADASGAPVIADLAAGPAPYLFEALSAHPAAVAIVADIDPVALAQARAAARNVGLEGRATFVNANAFERTALAELEPRPTIVIELGLYGIYPDDAMIERHFRDLAETVSPQQIVLNVQTENPEIEHIARVWRNARGQRCVWRLRPLELILRWADAAGYEAASIRADRHRIYRVARLERSR